MRNNDFPLRKIDVVRKAILAANTLISNLQNGGSSDYGNFATWANSLARYVLSPFIEGAPKHNTYMQDMLNLKQLVIQSIINKNNVSISITNLQTFICEVERITIELDLEAKVEYAPIINFVSFKHCS